MRLVDALGLTPRLVRARPEAARRLIRRAGKLRALPSTPRRFLTSDCLPLHARLRTMLEPFARHAPDGDESVFDFARRRLGTVAARVLVDAFVTGVYAGDPHRLSVRSAFPRLKALEEEHGSLLRGARGRGLGPRGVLTSIDDGMGTLVETLAAQFDLRCGAGWDALDRRDFDRVVCTIPAPRAADLATGELAEALRAIPTAPVVVCAMVFDDDLPVDDAFGFLAPHGEGLRILGALYDSSIFPGRAPAGLRLVRVLAGGRRDPEAAALPEGALRETIARDLRAAWGVWREPRAWQIIRHPLGIAQYEIGHAERIARIEALTPPWLRFTGSSYRGVSLNACVDEALA
jgi:oxygen-dependent protoporphyrinogen oxidase